MNRRNAVYLCLTGLGSVMATLLGCSGSAVGGGVAAIDQTDGMRQAPPGVEGDVADPAPNAIDTLTSLDQDTGQPDGIDDQTQETQPAYDWPNPDRSEIFLPPANKPARVTVEDRDDDGIALIGFANVDRLQVLLKIDGTIVPLSVGGSRGELQVLAIDPPQVTLKQGHREWTVKLFDTPD